MHDMNVQQQHSMNECIVHVLVFVACCFFMVILMSFILNCNFDTSTWLSVIYVTFSHMSHVQIVQSIRQYVCTCVMMMIMLMHVWIKHEEKQTEYRYRHTNTRFCLYKQI